MSQLKAEYEALRAMSPSPEKMTSMIANTQQAKRLVDGAIAVARRSVARRCVQADVRVQAWFIQAQSISQTAGVNIQTLRKMRALMIRSARARPRTNPSI
jgi:uncharacterized protein (DUF885 family)